MKTKDYNQNYIFGTCYQKIIGGLRAKVASVSKILHLISIVRFFPALLNACLNCVEAIIDKFLNLFSKVSGGLRPGATGISYTGHL